MIKLSEIKNGAILSMVIFLFVVLFSPFIFAQEKNKMTTFTKPSKEELRKKLSDEQYRVTQDCGTEPAFRNAFWNNKKPGIYVDIVTGEPLFSSKEKFDSGTGWPSFTKPLEKNNVVEKVDKSHGMVRTEVKSKHGDSHLGHVFPDGPGPEGTRYCINSAALRFIPVEKLKEEGYGEFLPLFEEPKGTEKALIAGGCFWGVEELFRQLPGVIDTEVGYSGGQLENPNYEKIKKGNTGHAESVQIIYDPKKVTYEAILEYFFRLHDPTTLNRQGNDRGTQYRSAIFVLNDSQKAVAEKVKAKVNASGKWKDPVVTEIVPAQTFYAAEPEHQDYLRRNPNGYTCHFLRD